MKRIRYSLGGLCVMWLCAVSQLQAQDSLRITLQQAEQIFLQKNLSLLAEKYNIDIAKAQIMQARLYPNPNISVTGNIYNPQQKKVLDVSNRTGEYILNAQQMIVLAGKRNKQIQMAQTGQSIAENNFYDLLRTLQYSLRSDFFSAYYLLNSIRAYQLQIQSIEQLNSSYEQLLQKGTVTLKDAVRIKSLLYSLKAELTSLQNKFMDVEAELQQLLQNNRVIYVPVSDSSLVGSYGLDKLSLSALIDTAYNNRADLKGIRNTLLLSQQNLSYQKALATPDLTLGVQFDKRGSFVDNASFFTAAIDLPFFHRNQGNIKAARLSIQQSQLNIDRQKQQVENEVQHAYLYVLNTEKMLKSIDTTFRTQFEQLLQSVTRNFEKRNMSLLEFTDFYESYKQSILQLNDAQNERMQALENLNFTCGKIVTGQ